MRRAQLQSIETILVAIVLILILLFGIYFFVRISDASLTEAQHEFRVDAVQASAQQLSYLPELSCPLEGGEARICIDKIKLRLLSEWLNDPTNPNYSDTNRLRFVEQFGNALIVVHITYPHAESIVLLNATSAENVVSQPLPINVYDATTDTLEFGIIQVSLE